VVTHQLQVERRTGKVRQSETDVLPRCHATNREQQRRTKRRARWPSAHKHLEAAYSVSRESYNDYTD